MQTSDITIIGGGIVGLATAYAIRQTRPDLSLLVLEKEPAPAQHQTGHNSGVIHSGLYYKPGSEKARTCREGRELLLAFAREHNLAHEICGKIVVATAASEIPNLARIQANGEANGLVGLRRISPEEIRNIEPHCEGVAGLTVPQAGIIDFPSVARKLAEVIRDSSGTETLWCNWQVTGITRTSERIQLTTSQEPIQTKYLIACGGLQSDRLARLDGLRPPLRIVPFRGDYYELTAAAKSKIRHLIYPVPDPAFPFLGVHFTRMISGDVECGPNAVFSFAREGYNRTAFDLSDSVSSLTYGGTWKLFARNWRQGWQEYRRAFSKKLFLQALQRLVPDLQSEDIHPGRAGIRAQALGSNGKMLDDFSIETTDRAVHVLNAPSPAATASLAIGQHIRDIALEHFK